jgi:hypothetical protein
MNALLKQQIKKNNLWKQCQGKNKCKYVTVKNLLSKNRMKRCL